MAYLAELRIIDAFKTFDVDGSGSLEAEEVVNILTRKTKKAMSPATRETRKQPTVPRWKALPPKTSPP